MPLVTVQKGIHVIVFPNGEGDTVRATLDFLKHEPVAVHELVLHTPRNAGFGAKSGGYVGVAFKIDKNLARLTIVGAVMPLEGIQRPC